MASTYQLLLNGTPADDTFQAALKTLEVEENADLPGAIQLALSVDRSDQGDLTFVNDRGLQPFANLAVVVSPEGGPDACLFDGYVLSHKLHLETGVTNSRLEVWGQDASWLMNLEEKAKEWVNVTDADAAAAIFSKYGISPAPDNRKENSSAHTASGQTLMQRASDIQFLRGLARRTGKLCRVACDQKPGQRIGYFAAPNLDGDAAVTLTLNDPEAWTVNALDIAWDVTRPTAVKARQALFNSSDADGASGDASTSGLPALSDRGLAVFAGKTMTALLTAPVSDGGELAMRARAMLRESEWFARCEGEAEVGRLGAILRVGQLVAVVGIGSVHSGKYYVWSVRHTITTDTHKMRFTLVRNAVGAAPSGGGGLLGALEGLL